MIRHILRQTRQVAKDPVLRRWLLQRIFKQNDEPLPFVPHYPPYTAKQIPLDVEESCQTFSEIGAGAPKDRVCLPLPGCALTLTPSQDPFQISYEDIETTLALHRFAWIPLLGCNIDPKWVNHLWWLWVARHDTVDDSWAWHPYTAAERSINLLDFARRTGLPGPSQRTVEMLADHAPAIAARLEYFGEHNTGNHLAKNGQGLYRLGSDLQLPKARELGFSILINEASRLFGKSGILREGSSHYHALYTRNFMDCWLAAKRSGHETEASELGEIVKNALSALRKISLPAGMPLIGDISPDCPPEFLRCLIDGEGGWTGLRDIEERNLIRELDKPAARQNWNTSFDGWYRLGCNKWQGLWHVPHNGWTFIPGHGHQDLGAPEIHFGKTPIFIDPGRGAYGETGDAAAYRSSAMHGGLRIDDKDPYPPNKPYYSKMFRKKITGPAPTVRSNKNEFSVSFSGYQRLRISNVTRTWRFSANSFQIDDQVDGIGSHMLERAFVTKGIVKITSNAVFVSLEDCAFDITDPMGACDVSVTPIKIWHAYGECTVGSRIAFRSKISTPWRGNLKVEISQ